MSKYSTNSFISKACEVHGDKYDYSKVEYVNSQTKVCIICPEHGEFWQTPNSHLNGNGCPSCAGLKKKDTALFIEKAREVHGDRYDYSKTRYINKRTPVTITCPVHGDFDQIANNHLRGNGCPLCGKKYASEHKKNNYSHFISESVKRFGDNYEFPYIETEYTNSHSKITIRCKKCGTTFTKIACDHLTSPNGGCLKCNNHVSQPENDIYEYISEKIGKDKVIHHDREAIKPFEIDIYIPSLNVGIEYNGLWWHSEQYKCTKNYHLEKTEMCNNKGIRLVQIFEDEYLYNKDIVLEKISHILGISNKEKVYARKTIVTDIEYHEAEAFLNKYHIQGSAKSTVYLGCFYEGKIIGVMTFKKENSYGKWELNRFATDYNYNCCGIGGKLFKHFIKQYTPNEIKSFADRRWSTDGRNLYTNLGFKFDSYTKPDYAYIKNGDAKRYHKFNFRKKALNNRYGADITMSEKEICENLGFKRIWNCGLIKYIWRNG